MNCDQRTDSIYLYAVGALPDDEADDLRRHLAMGCPACAGLLAEARTAAAMIPLADERAAVPPGLKARVMDRIDSASDAPSPPPPAWATRLFRIFVPAAVAAGIAVVVTHWVMNQKLADVNLRLVKADHDAAAMMTILQMQQNTVDAYAPAHQLVQVLQSSGLKLIPLQPTDQQPGAVGCLLYDLTSHRWTIAVEKMKPAASGQTYELWVVTSAGPRRAGLFDVDAKGSAYLSVDLPADVGQPTLSAVTNEKAGGSEKPTGQFQLKAVIQ